eukprot:SAG11_NODE_9417_length_913_cov_5.914005_1_plen_80_part_00
MGCGSSKSGTAAAVTGAAVREPEAAEDAVAKEGASVAAARQDTVSSYGSRQPVRRVNQSEAAMNDNHENRCVSEEADQA